MSKKDLDVNSIINEMWHVVRKAVIDTEDENMILDMTIIDETSKITCIEEELTNKIIYDDFAGENLTRIKKDYKEMLENIYESFKSFQEKYEL